MYLKKIMCENMGPISCVDIEPGFTQEGNPKPLILVGKNGSGKSILISNIVDSFFEFGDQAYADLANKVHFGHSFFKVASQIQIKNAEKNMHCLLQYKEESSLLEYLYCMHTDDIEAKSDTAMQYLSRILKHSSEQFKQTCRKSITEVKHVSQEKELIKKIFFNDAIAYYPPDRYTIPCWLGEVYARSNNTSIGMKTQTSIQDYLNKPIIVLNASKENLEWILDVVVDAKAELMFPPNNFQQIPIKGNITDIKALDLAKKNIEAILSAIFEKQVDLRLRYRNFGSTRLAVCEQGTDNVIVSSLNALSTGQALLFDMFTTIIKYGERENINNSIKLDQIHGIVVIDEIEIHLHADLQRNILPRLIKLFPKVQFVITSHSPLFLLGMQKEYGDDGFDIYEMPEGARINAEDFSEFGKAYDIIANTKKYQQNIERAIQEQSSSSKALIITEGPSDWKHMLRAWEKIKGDPRYSALNDKFEFLKYESVHTPPSGSLELQMGDSELIKVCESSSKIPQGRKLIFIADADQPEKTRKLTQPGQSYKDWGNSVYSFQIPIPPHRADPKICIEHYYSDEELKTEMNIVGKQCRLFLGCEFDRRGVSLDGKFICSPSNDCGPDKNKILEGDSKARITLIGDESATVGLSKIKFAEAILKGEPGFENISSEKFKLIFDVILDILITGTSAVEPVVNSSGGNDAN